jgi:hypothetical protein
MAGNNPIEKIANTYKDTTFNPAKKEEILKMYEKLGLVADDTKFDHIKKLGKFLNTDLESLSYIFPSGRGEYNGRQIEIAPSYSAGGVSNVGWNFIDSPSVLVKRGTNEGAYDYMVVKLETRADIGEKRILIFPKTFWNKAMAWLCFLKISDTGYKIFDDRYLVTLRGQEWFLKCLDREILDMMIRLELPGHYGATFQFSKNHATFAILPGTIGAEKIGEVIYILDRILNNIERVQ